jgi:hypothetical protein
MASFISVAVARGKIDQSSAMAPVTKGAAAAGFAVGSKASDVVAGAG